MTEIIVSEENNRVARFSSAPWAKYISKLPVLIIGAGGIGSWLSLLLAREEADIYLYDFDTIEEVNYAGQLFGNSHLDKPKVNATKELIQEFCNISINAFNTKYTEESFTNNIVVCCPDNMKARQDAFNNWVKKVTTLSLEEQKKCIYINAGLTAEQFIIHNVTVDKIDVFKKYLFNDGEIPKQLCSYKATSFAGAMIAGFITNSLNNFVSNRFNYKEDLRELPYEITYDASNFDLNF